MISLLIYPHHVSSAQSTTETCALDTPNNKVRLLSLGFVIQNPRYN